MHNGLHQLVEAIGLESALRIIAAWGGSTLYVPDRYDPEHLITKLLGEDSAIKLEMVYGGQTITVPKVNLHHIKLEVNVIKLITKFSIREVALILGISKERVKQIVSKHKKLKPENYAIKLKPNEQLKLLNVISPKGKDEYLYWDNEDNKK